MTVALDNLDDQIGPASDELGFNRFNARFVQPTPGGVLPRDVQQTLVDVAAPGTNDDKDLDGQILIIR